MARIRVTFDGATAVNGSPLMMHNERLADPIDPYSRWLKELSGKTKKTERDHEEMGRREFMGGGYWAVDGGPTGTRSEPVIPTWNIIRCIQAAATRYKLGRHVVRGIIPVNEDTPLQYDGPREAEELWKAGTFHSRKGVGVGQKKVMRTRPCFGEWKIETELELDLTMLDPDTVNILARDAGIFEGLGDARPRFGRFAGSAQLLGDPADYVAADVLDDVRQRLALMTAGATITKLDEAHSELHPNGKERKARVQKVAK